MLNLIQYIQHLIAITEEEASLIHTFFEERTYQKNSFFLTEGRVCKQVGFVTQGLLRYYINHEGEEKAYAFAQEGSFVCNYESFLVQASSSKTIQALEDTHMLTISYDSLQQFYKKIKAGERFGRLIAEQLYVQSLKDITSFYTDPPEIRYNRFIKNHSNLQQRLSQYHIASYVGVKPQSLSRIRKRMTKLP